MLDFIVSLYAKEDVRVLKEAGATSVIVASPFFSVRGVQTFSDEELQAIVTECKQLDMNVYCLVNRFFTEEELPSLRDHLKFLKQLQVDGIYYGDECVLYEAEQLQWKDKLIYNPDTLITNHEDVQFYLDEGIKMVSISKEITLDEICKISENIHGECEIIIHGRLNMMHSKRKLLTNYMTFVDKHESVYENKALYIMEETRDDHMPIFEDETGTHVFSGFTLVSFEELKTLVAHGVKHMRIEGLFHDVSYTVEALRYYQAILAGECDASEVYEAYKHKYEEDHVTHGFYYTKTSKVKEG